MQRITTIIILLLAVVTLSAQDITGKWTGALSFTDQMGQTNELRINFNISATDDGYSSTMDSPDQDAFGLKVNSTVFKKPELTLKADEYNLEYVGKVVDDANIKGTLTQHGQSFEMGLKKETE